MIADTETAKVLVQLHILNAFTPAECIDVFDLNGDGHGRSFPPAASSACEVRK